MSWLGTLIWAFIDCICDKGYFSVRFGQACHYMLWRIFSHGMAGHSGLGLH